MIFGGLSLALCVVAILWLSVLPFAHIGDAFSRSHPGWASTLLCLGSGILLGSLAGRALVRSNDEILDPAFLERVEKAGNWSTTTWFIFFLALFGFTVIFGIDSLLR